MQLQQMGFVVMGSVLDNMYMIYWHLQVLWSNLSETAMESNSSSFKVLDIYDILICNKLLLLNDIFILHVLLTLYSLIEEERVWYFLVKLTKIYLGILNCCSILCQTVSILLPQDSSYSHTMWGGGVKVKTIRLTGCFLITEWRRHRDTFGFKNITYHSGDRRGSRIL